MKDRLREIIISITNRCNLKCLMCQIPQISVNLEMTTAELKNLIQDAAGLNPNSIVFSGGEPLLRSDIFELIVFVNQHKINTCLTSNGTLIDDNTASRLKSAGVGVVNISIEGPEKIHDALRGEKSFTKAAQALKKLSRYKIETTIASIICRQNYKFLPYILELARYSGVTTVKFQPFSEIFLIEKEGKRNFFADEHQLEEIRRSIARAVKLAEKYKISTNPVNYLNAVPEYLCGIEQKLPQNSCSALRTSCPISAQGDVYPCWVLSRMCLGNVRKTRLSDIWNSDEHNRLRQLIVRDGCPGCLMSCYDYNLGKQGLKETLSLKAQKLKKAGFYKRLYYRNYQFLRYSLNKITNCFLNFTRLPKRPVSDKSGLLDEIRAAQVKLTKELKRLKK